MLLFLLAALAAVNVGIPLVSIVVPAAIMPWLHPTLQCLALLAATWLVTHRVDGAGWDLVGLGRPAWRARLLGGGALVGAVAIAVPTLLLIILGMLSFEDTPAEDVGRTLVQSVLILAPAAFTEELLMRGYPWAVLRGRWGWPVATAVTSVLFGLLHLGNPGVTALAIANVMAAGVFLAGVRVVTGSLAAAWTAHFAWNWTMSAGFHTAVSGLPFGTPGYRLVDSGPDWLSGGAWGPEGGALAAVGMIGAFAGLSWATRRRAQAGAGTVAAITNSTIAGGSLNHREHGS